MQVKNRTNKGTFVKGKSGNPKGKPAGSKHHKSKQWEQLGEAISTQHTDRFNEILHRLDDKSFVEIYLKILEYFKPKLQRSEIKHEGEKEIITTYEILPVNGKNNRN